ncbi:MAG: hypothetical protein N2578_03895, partial [Bdellovibrionaceae bacterium]|nr:hypothetical protein [Pseudobdellovibrionaceae bacterium]
MSLRIIIVVAAVLLAVSVASAQSVSVPFNVIKKPASDLLDRTGQPLDPSEAARRAQSGEDLSLLNPVENRMWQNRSYQAREFYPEFPVRGGRGVLFLSDEAQIPFTYIGRVQSLDDPQRFYRFSLSRYSHTTLLRAALLRKLGYYLPAPQYYSTLRVEFSSSSEKDEFLRRVQEGMISDFESRGWIAAQDERSVTFRDALLEIPTSDYFDIHWGLAPNPNNPVTLPLVQRLSRFRAYRALILPYVLADIPESINRFSPKAGSVLSGHVVLTHP